MLDPYAHLVKWVAAALSAVLVVALFWGAVVKPRSELAAERAAHQATRSAHAQLLADLAAKAQAAAESAARARTLFEKQAREADRVHKEGMAAAFEHGKAVGAAIAAGTVRVQRVWAERDCPATDAGTGTEPGRGVETLPPGRAAAIGEVLGLGAAFDADYALCAARLKSAQALLNQCFEKPAAP